MPLIFSPETSLMMIASYLDRLHYNAVIMGMKASQITSLTIAYSTVYSDADHLPLCGEFTGGQ